VGAECIYVDGGTANFPNQVNANIFSRRALLIRRSQARATFPAGEGFFVSYTSNGQPRTSVPTGFGLENKEKALFLYQSAPQRTV